jgi:hypothetical protein
MTECVVLTLTPIVMGQVLLNGEPLCSGDGNTVHVLFTRAGGKWQQGTDTVQGYSGDRVGAKGVLGGENRAAQKIINKYLQFKVVFLPSIPLVICLLSEKKVVYIIITRGCPHCQYFFIFIAMRCIIATQCCFITTHASPIIHTSRTACQAFVTNKKRVLHRYNTR